MADYYPLLARALKALPDPSEATRRAVYARARGALIGQLRSLEPPLSETDIEHERVALDAAIARLEEGYGGPPAPEPALAVPSAPVPAEPAPMAAPMAAPAPVAAPSPLKPPPELKLPPAVLPPPTPPEAAAEPAAVAPPLPAPEVVSRDVAPVVPAAATIPAPAAFPEAERPSAPPAIVPARPRSRTVAEPPRSEDDPADPAAAGRAQRPRIEIRAKRGGRGRLLRNLAVAAVLLMVIGLIGAAAWALRDRPSDLVAAAPEVASRTIAGDAAKIGDRVGGERPTPPASGAPSTARGAQPTAAPSQPSLTVAQRATLYEEDPANQQSPPKVIVGRVIWRLDAVNAGQGQPLETVVRANVEFPDAGGLNLAITIRRNTDATLPASHTVELVFSNTGGEPNRTVRDVGLFLMKEEENGRGVALAGLPVPVRDNLFLLGLSNLPNEVQRNTDLLRSRNWIDLPVRYVGGGRAVLTFEKGSAGDRVIQDAFAQWQ